MGGKLDDTTVIIAKIEKILADEVQAQTEEELWILLIKGIIVCPF